MSCLYCIRVSYPVLAFSALHVSMDTYHMPWVWDYKFLHSECLTQLHFPNGSLKVERIGYVCIVMTCQWRWLESLTICQNLPSLQCKVALFVSLVFVLGWMVDSTSISKALLIYLFIFGFGEGGGGWCLWQIGGESVSSIFSTQQRCLLFAFSRIINTISLPLPGIMS